MNIMLMSFGPSTIFTIFFIKQRLNKKEKTDGTTGLGRTTKRADRKEARNEMTHRWKSRLMSMGSSGLKGQLSGSGRAENAHFQNF